MLSPSFHSSAFPPRVREPPHRKRADTARPSPRRKDCVAAESTGRKSLKRRGFGELALPDRGHSVRAPREERAGVCTCVRLAKGVGVPEGGSGPRGPLYFPPRIHGSYFLGSVRFRRAWRNRPTSAAFPSSGPEPAFFRLRRPRRSWYLSSQGGFPELRGRSDWCE